MADHAFVRIVWPLDIQVPPDRPGIVIGFANSSLDYHVVSVVHDVSTKSCRNATAACHDESLDSTGPPDRPTGRPITVIGHVNQPSSARSARPVALQLKTKAGSAFPILVDLTINSASPAARSVQWIGVDRPSSRRMQFFSLSPIALGLEDRSEGYKWIAPLNRIDEVEEEQKARQARLVEKMKQHTVLPLERTAKAAAFSSIIDQLNRSADLAELVDRSIRQEPDRKTSRSWIGWLYPVYVRLLVVVLMVSRLLVEPVLVALEWRPFAGRALKDVSATAQQLDIRLQQCAYWPVQFSSLPTRSYAGRKDVTANADYIRFYNSVWLVANDVIIGIGLGQYLISNADALARLTDKVVLPSAFGGLRDWIVWLTGWPAGLKLNNELATFLGDLFVWVIDYWASYVGLAQPYFPVLIRLVGSASIVGATVPIAFCSDALSLLTIHVHGFYTISAKLYYLQLTILSSLFHLFRGKKNNVLRNRIDQCDYELDQLLLGTILFTILSFLLPTVVVFYLAFVGARMLIIGLKVLFEIVLACLNHFPLFALMLRVKDSRRIPGGVRIDITSPDQPVGWQESLLALFSFLQQPSDEPSDESIPSQKRDGRTFRSSHLVLGSLPLPLHLIFHSYVHLAARLQAHYLSSQVVICLLTGRFVPPIDRRNMYGLQYRMLPAQRVGLFDLWTKLRHEVGLADKQAAEM